MNHIGICLRESANISDPMKHVILTKWNANSDSTKKVILIFKKKTNKHGQLVHIALKRKQMINNIFIDIEKTLL